MNILGRIFFLMNTLYFKTLLYSVHIHFYESIQTKWLIRLSNLIVFSHIRIKIIFPIPTTQLINRTVQQHTRLATQLNCFFIQHRHSARIAQANRANMCIRRCSINIFTTTKHLRYCLLHHVCFEPNSRFVFIHVMTPACVDANRYFAHTDRQYLKWFVH